jgi:7-cyano-7-deazaguanine synthase in queuosine biosynthesis
MKKEVVLCSTGLDSFILTRYLNLHHHDFDCLYFNHGGKYVETEMKYLDPSVKIITNLCFKDIELPDAFIPNRNILMAVMANSLGYNKIWIGGSASDRVQDNNKKVFEQLSEFLTKMTGRIIEVDSPFWDCYKENMIQWFIKNGGISHDLVTKTFSCFYPLIKPQKIKMNYNYFMDNFEYDTPECLNCPACFRKCASMWSADHFIPFYNKSIIKKYKDEFTNCLIETPRSKNTLSYIRELNIRL